MAHNLLVVSDLAPTEITTVLDLSERPDLPRVLEGRGAALVFEFPSARTRNAAEMAVVDLGGHPITIRGEEIGFDVRESVEDVARTLGCYHALIAARVAEHRTLDRMGAALGGFGPPSPRRQSAVSLRAPVRGARRRADDPAVPRIARRKARRLHR